jgi:protein TonB
VIRPAEKFIFLAMLAAALVLSAAAADQPRKIKSQVMPILPEMAKQMSLKGTVRLEVEIDADGVVKSTKPLGGHPLLIQSAEAAIRKWRYESGPPTKTIVEFNFHQ